MERIGIRVLVVFISVLLVEQRDCRKRRLLQLSAQDENLEMR